MSHFEKDAIISGLGISRIGRRTGIPGLELTLEAARAAIEDAGLTADDIDGIATFGDTPLAEVNACASATKRRINLRVRHRRSAHPRHVGLSRRRPRGGPATSWSIEPSLMLGGSMTASARLSRAQPAGQPAGRAAHPRNAKEAQAVRGHRRTAGRPRLLGRELAGDALSAPHGALWNDQGAAGLAGDQQQAQRRPQSARRVP